MSRLEKQPFTARCHSSPNCSLTSHFRFPEWCWTAVKQSLTPHRSTNAPALSSHLFTLLFNFDSITCATEPRLLLSYRHTERQTGLGSNCWTVYLHASGQNFGHKLTSTGLWTSWGLAGVKVLLFSTCPSEKTAADSKKKNVRCAAGPAQVRVRKRTVYPIIGALSEEKGNLDTFKVQKILLLITFKALRHYFLFWNKMVLFCSR